MIETRATTMSGQDGQTRTIAMEPHVEVTLPHYPTISTAFQRRLKRGMDVVIALLLLLLLLPVFVAVAVAIKLNSRGPVFYRQPRLGKGPEMFDIWKFRTMIVGADVLRDDFMHLNEASGPLFKLRYDPRVTTVGQFLRRHYLDELPQLWNVVRGEMSLVGPRPCLYREMLSIPKESWVFRFSVPQGMTGPWQTNGHHELTFEQQMDVERDYVENWSLALDVKILLRTLPLVLHRTGL